MNVLKVLMAATILLPISGQLAAANPKCFDEVRAAYEEDTGDKVSIVPLSVAQALDELSHAADWRAKSQTEMIQNMVEDDNGTVIYRVNVEFDSNGVRYEQEFFSVRKSDCQNYGRLPRNDASVKK